MKNDILIQLQVSRGFYLGPIQLHITPTTLKIVT